MKRTGTFCKRGIVFMITIALAAVLASPAFAADKSCATKYPIILAHGMGFYPTNTLENSFPDIKEALEQCGATVYVTQVEPLGTSDEKAAQFINGFRWGTDEVSEDGYENYPLTVFPGFNQIKEESGAEKFHIIGHSQGGLYTRWAITMGEAKFDTENPVPVNPIAPYVASLTTVDSPHLGSQIDDIQVQLAKMMPNMSEELADSINPYNLEYIARNSGETVADVEAKLAENTDDLTSKHMKEFNEIVPMPNPATGRIDGKKADGVYYQSFSCAFRKYNVLQALQHQVQQMMDLNNGVEPVLPAADDGEALAAYIEAPFADYAALCYLYGGGQGDGLVQVNSAKLGVFLGVQLGRQFSEGLNHFDAVNINNKDPEKWDAIKYYKKLVQDLVALEKNM